jgi:hypothetical protein
VYIPPEYSRYSSPDAFSQIENEYLEFTEKFKNICLIGDFNARTAEDVKLPSLLSPILPFTINKSFPLHKLSKRLP